MSLLNHSKRELKQKKRAASKAAIRESLEKDFGPIANKIGSKVGGPVVRAAKAHPKRAFAIMIAIIIANMAILYFFTDSFKFNKSSGFDFNYSEMVPDFNVPDVKKQFNYSWTNFWTMKNIKDSMEYLMSKNHLSKQDTLLFIRLSERMGEIDTGYHPIPLPNQQNAKP